MIQANPVHGCPSFLRSVVMLSSNLRLYIPRGGFLSGFHSKTLNAFLLSHACHISRNSNFPLFHRRSNICYEVKNPGALWSSFFLFTVLKMDCHLRSNLIHRKVPTSLWFSLEIATHLLSQTCSCKAESFVCWIVISEFQYNWILGVFHNTHTCCMQQITNKRTPPPGRPGPPRPDWRWFVLTMHVTVIVPVTTNLSRHLLRRLLYVVAIK